MNHMVNRKKYLRISQVKGELHLNIKISQVKGELHLHIDKQKNNFFQYKIKTWTAVLKLTMMMKMKTLLMSQKLILPTF